MENETQGGEGRRAGDRGRYGRLTRERVLVTALEVVDRDGLSGLSMRKLGAELGVEAMALYRYAPSKSDLLDGLVEAFCGELEQVLGEDPEAAGAQAADWRRGLHRIALTTYRVGLRHPHVVPLLATRLLSTPLARRPPAVLRSDERVLSLLHAAGMNDRRTVSVHRAFTAWLLGYLIVELRAMDDEPAEPDPAFRLGLHRMPAQELPRLRAIALALAERGGPEQLAAGLDALLDRFD
ncbi:TetR/AcrR family transcriptional regulator [Streptomyces purpurogeneiscleroticus]|uniref:TetR/AcrR family transcriptional regulator n=1 Tax=Streptomyces purpurogeneiscleroticus TaxID=68259 RepID=UPI001CBFC169|nr:TetR/AcrR family transcriptional regulator [Streptomyces purpurogeneiscleroticus]MBZ4020394.1 TetR family transcriptional regulator [Streptomyces purpurogeneiscleroticus]